MHLSERAKTALSACAEASLPAGRILPAGGESTVQTLDKAIATMPQPIGLALESLARAADVLALPHGRASMASLPLSKRFALLEAWRTSKAYPARSAFRALMTALKGAHYGNPNLARLCGQRQPLDSISPEAEARWTAQIHDLGNAGGAETLEADVVIIGSGAGGAAAARVLAEAGLAIVILESGAYYRRSDFVGSYLARIGRMYAQAGLQSTLGDSAILLPTGHAVGGTTLINAGTCMRTPPWILRHWREHLGIAFDTAELERAFSDVEAWLHVETPPPERLGMQAKIIARGADAMGLAHGPLLRNAPGCDAQGQCCFGCPTGAKQTADVALLPAALSAGALLFARATVEHLERRAGEVQVRARGPHGRTVVVKARSAIVAAGALRTPRLLHMAGLRHPWLGRNLSIHPAAAATALYPFEVRMDEAVPQGYGLEALREQGLLFEGAGTPFEVTAIGLGLHGPRLVELLEQHERLLTFGFNVRDTSRGRVLAGPGGMPLGLYTLNGGDLAQFQFGLRTLVDLLAHGGATHIFPPIAGMDEIPGVVAGRALDGRAFKATDLDLSAYHPLGTARMGSDASISVLDMEQRVRGAPELLVCDGSAVPTSMGANPQVTIMALSARAARRLAERLG